jgi:hypothetical protein
MRKSILNNCFVCLLLLTAFGCRVRKPIAPVVVAPTQTAPSTGTGNINSAEVIGNISAKQIRFNTLSIKAKADLDINNNKNSVTMNIRMQHAKAIWVSVSVPIIGEVARTLITPDSIKIINKLENSYTKKPFSFIYQYANNQINFQSLEDLFVGNAFAGTLTASSSIKVNGGQTHIGGNLSDLAYLLIFNDNLNLLQSNLSDKAAGQNLTTNYGEYRNVEGQTFPGALSIRSAVSNKGISVDMQYSQIGLNEPVDFPFSVPKRFTVKD